MDTEPRLGRPPASNSVETRRRIIDVARRCFASLGYEATTNRMLASEAGITTGAMYHYFDSKLDIYREVNREAQARVYARFGEAEREADTFLGKINAVLESASQLNREDPTLARFIAASRIDRIRSPELSEALGTDVSRRAEFFGAIVARGVETGEIHANHAANALATLQAFTLGLAYGSSDDLTEHRHAIDGFKALLAGSLVDAPLSGQG